MRGSGPHLYLRPPLSASPGNCCSKMPYDVMTRVDDPVSFSASKRTVSNYRRYPVHCAVCNTTFSPSYFSVRLDSSPAKGCSSHFPISPASSRHQTDPNDQTNHSNQLGSTIQIDRHERHSQPQTSWAQRSRRLRVSMTCRILSAAIRKFVDLNGRHRRTRFHLWHSSVNWSNETS